MSDIFVKCMQGFGDTIYNRAIVKHLAKTNTVYLETILPRFFEDIPNIKYTEPPKFTFRTQEKARQDSGIKYHKLPESIYTVDTFYGIEDLQQSSIVGSMYKKAQIPFNEKLEWSLPDFSKDFRLTGFHEKLPKNRKIAIIRPATIRAEWKIHTRNAKPEYIAWVCKVLKEYGYYTIAIADLEERKEWLADGVDVPADMKLYSGELGIYATMHLIKLADIVVGGSGFIIPTCASTDTPQFILFGGRGMFDSPYKVFHPTMNMKKIGWAVPQNFCRCTNTIHTCDKTIPTLETDLLHFLEKINAQF